jgi:hypothetical protein
MAALEVVREMARVAIEQARGNERNGMPRRDQPQADAYEVQVSTDPITANSWTPAPSVSVTETRVVGLPSGTKRWVRVRAFNRLGAGSWSDPACRMVP